ncbi:hypothetical protein AAE478_006400 [Parahypoxylon ruwenzoriense]
MQSISIFALLSALALTSASPLRRRCGGSGTVTNSTDPAPPTAAIPALPSTGSGTQLDSPGGAMLKHIVVGHGIQNYTCAAAGATATSFGALAVVWEITHLYPGSGENSLSEADWSSLTSKVLRTTALPLNLASSSPNTNTNTTASSANQGADTTAPFPTPSDLTVSGISSPLPYLGHHFFDSANTPTFELTDPSSPLFKGKKDAGIPAPATADAGADPATGAVDWLRLSDKGMSEGVALVYRVLTAGGNPEACGPEGEVQSVPYAAQYWIYGN